MKNDSLEGVDFFGLPWGFHYSVRECRRGGCAERRDRRPALLYVVAGFVFDEKPAAWMGGGLGAGWSGWRSIIRAVGSITPVTLVTIVVLADGVAEGSCGDDSGNGDSGMDGLDGVSFGVVGGHAALQERCAEQQGDQVKAF